MGTKGRAPAGAAPPRERLKVAVLGSGNIGADLLAKVLRSEWLQCTLFAGRNRDSRGLAKASGCGVRVSDRGIEAITDDPECCDLVFDATNAFSHVRHARVLAELGKVAVDLTPSNVGHMCVPAVNLAECLSYGNVNMVTCGGQASIPLAHVVGAVLGEVEYIEVISMIASRSAGPATRANLDEYIDTTERGVLAFSGCRRAKAILNLNPAQPCVDMQTTLLAKVADPDLERLGPAVDEMVEVIQRYVPGYSLLVPPSIEGGRLAMMVRVRGRGDYLPSYAGNLDIINCAAVELAEEHARGRGGGSAGEEP
jgi:acetaldehyde dehydrogenase (acetylating)